MYSFLYEQYDGTDPIAQWCDRWEGPAPSMQTSELPGFRGSDQSIGCEWTDPDGAPTVVMAWLENGYIYWVREKARVNLNSSVGTAPSLSALTTAVSRWRVAALSNAPVSDLGTQANPYDVTAVLCSNDRMGAIGTDGGTLKQCINGTWTD